MSPELLFDNVVRTETRTRHERESAYAYYNLSAREPISAVRSVLQRWFDSYPQDARSDLRARFRSPIDSQHKSAFWELYLHELFAQMGYALEPHPRLEGSPNRPDFLASCRGKGRFYLEAVVAGLPSVKDAGAEARLSEVFDLVNRLDSPDYFLKLDYRGTPETPPPVRLLAAKLQSWLASLDICVIEDACRRGDFDDLPRFEWSHEGLTLSFMPVAKSPSKRGGGGSRPIGIMMGEPHYLTTNQEIREAVEKKAKKYGHLPWPLVVGVNVLSEHCDEIDVNNALFGDEELVVTQKSDGSLTDPVGRRKPNGVWFGNKGPRNHSVSSVLIGMGLDPFTAGTATPVLMHNPYVEVPLALPYYPLPQSIPDHATRRMKKTDGRHPKEFLRLPSPWPPNMDY